MIASEKKAAEEKAAADATESIRKAAEEAAAKENETADSSDFERPLGKETTSAPAEPDQHAF